MHNLPRRQSGLSLIELMIAMAIGLIILAGMVSIFASSSQSHNELEKASRQIENGRYAIEMLREEIELAGFYGDYMPISSTTWTTPDPCTTILNDMQFSAAAVPPSIPSGLYGIDGADALSGNCATILSNRQSGTDILVVRRASTTSIALDADADNVLDTPQPITTDEYYLQVSNCADAPAESAFVMSRIPGDFTLHTVKPAGAPLSCMNGGLAPARKYVVRLFYIATCNICSPSDGIPTLKMVELTGGSGCGNDPSTACGSFTSLPIAEGIENMQLEFGIDNKLQSGVSGADGSPDAYETASAVTTWNDVVSARAFILARNTEPSMGYTNTKTYVLSSDGSVTVSGGNDHYRRHAYALTARANNIAGRRQQ
ncbi:MAG: PilW family protein [Rhodocyclaceae bacterium]|nr:PilW family protein [Rhodocyclaceae bacterium]MDZ4214693.1 PilW family protein [Rhodocyclaceae bacterium]